MNEQSQLNDLAREAYNAYAEHRDWTSYNGEAMPQWDEMNLGIMAAWEAAAAKVVELS